MSDKLKYDEDKYYSYLLNYEVRKAYNYLVKCEQFDLSSKLETRFADNHYENRSSNQFVREVDYLYQDYYKDIFWKELDKFTATKKLYKSLCLFMEDNNLLEDYSYQEKNNLELVYEEIFKLGDKLQKLFEKIGYHFLGGRTAGYLGPYIWRKNKTIEYEVELPNGIQNYTVTMMSKFVSKSWLDYVSLGVLSTGGWQNEDSMNCVVASYPARVRKTAKFKVSFLKHEAQHAYDYIHYPNLSPVQLEYRAKLVELIYYPRISLFLNFLSYASADDKNNAHSYVAYHIAKGLSEIIFEREYENDKNAWKGKLKQIKEKSLVLFNQSLEKEF